MQAKSWSVLVALLVLTLPVQAHERPRPAPDRVPAHLVDRQPSTDPRSARAIEPCLRPDLWPLRLHSRRYPVWIHYQLQSHEPVARAVLRYLEQAWRFEVEGLGFSAPIADEGGCGPDAGLDVFLWRGTQVDYVAQLAENPLTAWDDARTYMVLDPWGPYGGEFLRTALAHELNHVLQAAQDWWESAIAFEMTAQFVEWLVAQNHQVYFEVLRDFQKHPDWAVDHDDGYVTYFMYGAALYLHFLRDRYFDGNARFVSEMWRRSRNPPGAEQDPLLNEPDFQDALDQMFQDRGLGIGYADTVIEFTRWRWYTGKNTDRDHFRGMARIPGVRTEARLAVGRAVQSVEVRPMAMGSAYIEVRAARPGLRAVEVRLDAPQVEGIRWVLQAVPGLQPGVDGEVVELQDNTARVRLADSGRRTLILTALSDVDTDQRNLDPIRRYPATLSVGP